QWIPDHDALLLELTGKLNEGGVLAVQFPMNGDEPLYRIISEVAAEPRWKLGDTYFETNEALEPDAYFDILSGCASSYQIWETTYRHVLPSHQALVDWVKGTRLRPYLAALDGETAAEFEREIVKRAAAAYPVRKTGEVVLGFRRFFFTAMK
ncbi:MAG: trans-aconitate methyltransferase, partial [Oscillospiraceae bacterium]|nr:trans-aconitate methyltransferase [Oscillospiraceae bacterium]